MEILDIVSTVIDLSNKGSEYNEEIAQLNLTVVTLQKLLTNLEKLKALDELQMKTMREQLQEASQVLQKVSKQSNWWRNVKNMFPGSELSQIKDINTKIERSIQLINLTVTTHGMKKRRHNQDSDSDSQQSSFKRPAFNKKKIKPNDEDIVDTVPLDMFKPTFQIVPSDGQAKVNEDAFSLKLATEESKIKKIAKAEKLDKIFATWKQSSTDQDVLESQIEIGRLMFQKMPPEVTIVISKKHCVIYAKRVRKAIFEESKALIAETLCMQDLIFNVPSKNKKKNPSIRINGEKVIDSDIEEKKEIELKNGSKKKKSEGNYLTVDFPKARSISSQPSQKKKVIVEETKSEKSSQLSDDIFYTCPQIEESAKKFEYEETYEIEDFSTNGTCLNGVKIQKGKRIPIKNNDEIGIVVRVPDQANDSQAEASRLELGYIFRDAK